MNNPVPISMLFALLLTFPALIASGGIYEKSQEYKLELKEVLNVSNKILHEKLEKENWNIIF